MLRIIVSTLLFFAFSKVHLLVAQQEAFSFTSFQTQVIDNQCFGKFSVHFENTGDLYLMERSKDGENFEQVGDWIETHMATAANSYECWDLEPLAGISYYRIRRIALTEGVYDFSEVLQIVNMPEDKQVIVRPNPFQEQFTIEFTNQPYPHSTIQVVNMLGQVVHTSYVPDQAIMMPIDLEQQVAGMYFIWIIQNGRRRLMETVVKLGD